MGTPIEPQDTGQDDLGNDDGGDDWGGNFNPKWETVLSQIPPELHAKVAPELAKWDRGVQQQFQKYAPWKDVLSSGMDPNAAQQAIALARSMQEDPRGVYDAMAKHYNFEQAQAALQDAKDDLEEANPWEAGYKELQQRVDLLGRALLSNYEKEQETVKAQQQDAELDKALKAAAQKFGPAWNEQKALQIIKGFDTVEEAYDFYLHGGQSSQQRPAPRVMGTGSTFPQFGNKRPADLDDSERVKLITQMIEDQKRA